MAEGIPCSRQDMEPTRHRHHSLLQMSLFDMDQLQPHMVFNLVAAALARYYKHNTTSFLPLMTWPLARNSDNS